MARHQMAKVEGYGREYRVIEECNEGLYRYGVYRREWNAKTLSYRMRLADWYDTYTGAVRAVSYMLYTDKPWRAEQ